MNINTRSYWEDRFGSGDWSRKGGHSQTEAFARAQVPLFGLPGSFDGTICDFGCGAGDAFPVYRAAWPHARLIGIDFAENAINLAIQQHGHLAEFYAGDMESVPICDVIIASNVVEHMTDDEAVIDRLLNRCRQLFVTVPFLEPIEPGGEHLRSYEVQSFSRFSPTSCQVFTARGWSQYGSRLFREVYLPNLGRLLSGRPLLRRKRQVMYVFTGRAARDGGQT